MRVLILPCFLLLSFIGLAQDISGVWLADNYYSKEGEYAMIYVKVDSTGKVSGMIHDVVKNGFCFYTVEGNYNRKKKKLNIKADQIIEKTQNHTNTSFKLKYSKTNSEEFLKGKIEIGHKKYSSNAEIVESVNLGVITSGKVIIAEDLNVKKLNENITFHKSKIDSLVHKPMYKDIIAHLYNNGFIEKDSAFLYLSKKFKVTKREAVSKKTIIARYKTDSEKITLEIFDKNPNIDSLNMIDVYLNKTVIQENVQISNTPTKLEINLPSNQKKNRIIFKNSNPEKESSNSVILKYSFDDKDYESLLDIAKGEDKYLEFKYE